MFFAITTAPAVFILVPAPWPVESPKFGTRLVLVEGPEPVGSSVSAKGPGAVEVFGAIDVFELAEGSRSEEVYDPTEVSRPVGDLYKFLNL